MKSVPPSPTTLLGKASNTRVTILRINSALSGYEGQGLGGAKYQGVPRTQSRVYLKRRGKRFVSAVIELQVPTIAK